MGGCFAARAGKLFRDWRWSHDGGRTWIKSNCRAAASISTAQDKADQDRKAEEQRTANSEVVNQETAQDKLDEDRKAKEQRTADSEDVNRETAQDRSDEDRKTEEQRTADSGAVHQETAQDKHDEDRKAEEQRIADSGTVHQEAAQHRHDEDRKAEGQRATDSEAVRQVGTSSLRSIDDVDVGDVVQVINDSQAIVRVCGRAGLSRQVWETAWKASAGKVVRVLQKDRTNGQVKCRLQDTGRDVWFALAALTVVGHGERPLHTYEKSVPSNRSNHSGSTNTDDAERITVVSAGAGVRSAADFAGLLSGAHGAQIVTWLCTSLPSEQWLPMASFCALIVATVCGIFPLSARLRPWCMQACAGFVSAVVP